MSAPRFVPVRGARHGVVVVPPWPGLGRPFAGETTSSGQWVSWRFLGANNRELSRAAVAFPSAVECLDAVRTVRAFAPLASPVLELDVTTGLWGWSLVLMSRVAAISGRRYARQRDARSAFQHFVEFAEQSEPVALGTGAWSEDGSATDLRKRAS